MDVEFMPRSEAWDRPTRGRTPERCPEELRALLRAAADRPDEVAVFDARGSSKHERSRIVVLLKRGAAELGVTVRYRTDSKSIRFYVEAQTDGQ